MSEGAKSGEADGSNSSDDAVTGSAANPDLSRAVTSWLTYSEGTESLVHLTHEGLSWALALPAAQRESGAPADVIAYADHMAKYARREMDSGFATLHAHSLLGLWGAFECFVEDIFLATLKNHPELLASEAFAKVKLPVASLVLQDQDDRLRTLLSEVSRASGSDLALGTTKFERLLDTVGLGGQIPDSVRKSTFSAQQIRNVWAHRGGLADARFVERCGSLGFGIGDKVNMPATVFLHLMHGLHTYGFVILDRVRVQHGEEPLRMACVGYRESEQGTQPA